MLAIYIRCKVIEKLREGKFLSILIFLIRYFMVLVFLALSMCATPQFFVVVVVRGRTEFL